MKYFIPLICFLQLLALRVISQEVYCVGSTISFTSSITGQSYQWQMDSGAGFRNIIPGINIPSVNSRDLQIINSPAGWYNFQFRCYADGDYSDIITLQFRSTWTGASSYDFSDPSNWSCGLVPDGNTDVVVDNDTIQLTSNRSIRSLTLKNGGYIDVRPGIILNIAGKDTLLNDFNLTIDDIEFLDSITIDAPISRPSRIATGSNDNSMVSNLINDLLEHGRQLCRLKTQVSPPSDTGNVAAPLIYNGLAYSYGSRQVIETKKPPEGDALHKRYPVLGTDCSGMMIILLRAKNIPISEGATTVTFESKLRNAVTNNTTYPTLRIINLDSLPENKVCPGDFMLWRQKRHIGIVQNESNYKILYQSNGNPNPLTELGWKVKPVNNVGGIKRTAYEEQFLNWGEKRGASVKKFTLAVFGSGYWGTKYTLLRFAEVFNMTNTPVFTTNNFTSVQVGKGGYIYAGTANQGLYKYNGVNWEKLTVLTNNNIQHLQRDKNEGIWVAQSGNTGAQAITGGVNHFPDTTYTGYSYYGATMGLPTRNCRSIFIDTTRLHQNVNTRLWTANMSDITGGVSITGAVGLGLNTASPFFNKITRGIETTNGLGSVQCIGGNSNEIWAYAAVNYGRSQIRRYNAETGDSISPVGAYDYTNTPLLSSNFAARAIYFDKSDKRWIGFTSGGIVVNENNNWIAINFPELFPAGTLVNTNGITGNNNGEIFIGTTSGLIIYNGIGPLNEIKSYKKLTSAHGLPSNNVKGICYDQERKRLILTTDNGIFIMQYQ